MIERGGSLIFFMKGIVMAKVFRCLQFGLVLACITVLLLATILLDEFVDKIRPLFGWWFKILPEFRASILLFVIMSTLMLWRHEGSAWEMVGIVLLTIAFCPVALMTLMLLFGYDTENKDYETDHA